MDSSVVKTVGKVKGVTTWRLQSVTHTAHLFLYSNLCIYVIAQSDLAVRLIMQPYSKYKHYDNKLSHGLHFDLSIPVVTNGIKGRYPAFSTWI